MPSKTARQHNLMAMVANDPAAAKRLGVPQSVGKEFMRADKGKSFGKGAPTRATQMAVNKPKTDHGGKTLFSSGGKMRESKAMVKKEVAFMKKKGAPASMVKHEESEMKKMKKGGMVQSKMGKVVSGGKRPHGEHTVQQKGHTKARQIAMKRGGMC